MYHPYIYRYVALTSTSQKDEKSTTEHRINHQANELRLWATWWACAVTRHASRRAYEAKGRATSATDVFDNVGGVVEEVAPSPPVV